MELGYEFFLDRATLQSRFIVADVFKGTAQGNAWRDLEEHGVDVVHCSAFFHLFPLEEQISSAKNITKLVKKGGMIVGRQIGSIKPGDLPAAKKGTFSYRHDVKTLNAMWEKVGEDTQTRWEVKGSLDLVGHNPLKPTNFEDENSRRLLYTVIRLE